METLESIRANPSPIQQNIFLILSLKRTVGKLIADWCTNQISLNRDEKEKKAYLSNPIRLDPRKVTY